MNPKFIKDIIEQTFIVSALAFLFYNPYNLVHIADNLHQLWAYMFFLWLGVSYMYYVPKLMERRNTRR